MRDEAGKLLLPKNHVVDVGAGETLQVSARLVDSFGYAVRAVGRVDGSIDSALVKEKTRAVALWISLEKPVRTGFRNHS